MKKANLRTINFLVFFILCLISNVEACINSAVDRTWVMKKDALDRLIVLWIDSAINPSLNISIDRSPPTAISLPDQQCVSPAFDVSPEGDIVVTWGVLNLKTSVMDLYSASLPFGGSWSSPVVISDGAESIIQGSNTVEVTHAGKIDVCWESMVYFPSVSDPEVIKKEVHTATGTLSAWQPATVVGVIRQYGE